MQILKFDPQKPLTEQTQVLETAVKVWRDGGLVLFPTETTYGAGVNATHQAAVDKLLKYKARREGKPLSIAVTDIEMAERYVEVNDQARQLYARFLPGPVTVVSKDRGVVANGVASEFGTLGVRIPAYPLVLEAVKRLDVPITATSANASGEKRPYAISDVLDNLSQAQKDLIDLIIDAGTLPPNPPSTVIDTTLSTPVTVRQGEVQASEPTGPVLELHSSSEAETRAIAGRFMLKHWDDLKTRGVVIGLDGPLGAGKTVFTKGIAEFLQISETITSPTYTYLQEYPYQRHGQSGNLYHLDVWKIDSDEMSKKMDMPALLAGGNAIVIEWWSQIAQLSSTQSWLEAAKPVLVVVQIDEVPTGRQLRIQET